MEDVMVGNDFEEPVDDTQDNGQDEPRADMPSDLADLFPPEDAVRDKQSQKKQQDTVPLKALKEERSKRQMYERQLNELMAMHKEVLQQLQMLRAQPQTNERAVEDVIEDDSVITGADLKKILAQERERLLGETKKTTSVQALINARQRYSDFDEVVRYADDLIASNPELRGLEEYILSHPNAPYIAYSLGKLHPEYQRKMSTTQSLSDRIAKNMEIPQPVRKSSTEVANMYERIAKLDPLSKEFEELDRRIKLRFRERGEQI